MPEDSLPADFNERSRWVDIDGPLHYFDYGGPADGPTIVAVHGLDGSALNWSAIAPLLTRRFRLIAPDLAGHGLTRPGRRDTTVVANRALLHRFLQATTEGPVLLMGNSMGGMISLLQAATAPETVSGLVLICPALPVVATRPDPAVAAMLALYATPGLGQLVAAHRRRRSPEARVATTLALTCADPSRVPPEVVAEHVELARRRAASPDSTRAAVAAAGSVVATAGRLFGRPYRRRISAVTAPTLVVHGACDRLIPVAAARAAARANPAWSLVVLPEVGHVPQLEASRETADAVLSWADGAGREAARAAAAAIPPA